MRKVPDQELLSMYRSGITKREISKHYQVSEQYIGQRIKTLESIPKPEVFSKLSPTKQKYALARLEGLNQKDSAKKACSCTDKSASVIGSRYNSDPDIKKAMAQLLYESGVGKRKRAERLADLINAPDLSTVAKGLDLSFKVLGDYAPAQVELGLSDDLIGKLIDSVVERNCSPVIEI